LFTVKGALIFAGTQGGGVFRSSDNGDTWIQVNSGLTNQSILSLTVGGTNVFAGTIGDGVFVSADNGDNWTAVNTGLTDLVVTSLVVNNNTVFAGTNSGMFVSINNGNIWTPGGLAGEIIQFVSVANSKVFAGTFHGLFHSIDNGANWDLDNNGLSGATVLCVAEREGKLYAGTSGVFVFDDNSGSWQGTTLTDEPVYALIVAGHYLDRFPLPMAFLDRLMVA